MTSTWGCGSTIALQAMLAVNSEGSNDFNSGEQKAELAKANLAVNSEGSNDFNASACTSVLVICTLAVNSERSNDFNASIAPNLLTALTRGGSRVCRPCPCDKCDDVLFIRLIDGIATDYEGRICRRRRPCELKTKAPKSGCLPALSGQGVMSSTPDGTSRDEDSVAIVIQI